MKKVLTTVFGRENFLRLTLPILLVIALIIIGLVSFQKPSATAKDLTPDQAKARAETFINKYLMQSGSTATIKSITEQYGLYKLDVDITNNVVQSYLTKDGKLFFPQALDIDQVSNGGSTNPAAGNQAAAPTVTTVSQKSNKPNIELFVMSYCPYGTQIEKGILPALSALGNSVNFQLKFVDYSMHGPQELAENMNQYCIRKNEPQKLEAYLTCFLKAGDSAGCLTSAGINKQQLTSCVAATDAQYKITANANNNINYQGSYPSFPIDQADNVKYNVVGSPTLVINGQTVESQRDPASLLKTICSAFNSQPAACQTVLASATPAPGIGTGTASGGSAAAGCGQ